MEIFKKIRNATGTDKSKLALGLVVAAAGFLAPDSAKSTNYCTPGSNGDCAVITDGNKHCAVGGWTKDCT